MKWLSGIPAKTTVTLNLKNLALYDYNQSRLAFLLNHMQTMIKRLRSLFTAKKP
jgi:hypothetical protein